MWQYARRGSCSRRSSAACSRCAGSAYQGVFRNPLADPYLLGVAAGAGLGATLAIAYASAGERAGELLPLVGVRGRDPRGERRLPPRPLGRGAREAAAR